MNPKDRIDLLLETNANLSHLLFKYQQRLEHFENYLNGIFEILDQKKTRSKTEELEYQCLKEVLMSMQ